MAANPFLLINLRALFSLDNQIVTCTLMGQKVAETANNIQALPPD
jgi:hypothetical protein